MVTFCLGSARQKRAYFEEASGVIVLDNVEVLFCASENGRNYFAYGDMPFGSFTVEEYLTYHRAIGSEGCFGMSEKLKNLGLKRDKRIGRLTPVEMRCVTYLEKAWGGSDKALVINLDGTRYTRRGNKQLKKLLKAARDAYVCVTDDRFIRNADAGYKTMTFGKTATAARAKFFEAKKLAKRIGAKRIAII